MTEVIELTWLALRELGKVGNRKAQPPTVCGSEIAIFFIFFEIIDGGNLIVFDR